MSDFLIEMGEDGKQAKLFVDDSKLVVGKDSFSSLFIRWK
jgi:hypothetical protein